MKLSTQRLFDDCYGKYAIAAVNVFTMEQVLGVFEAASVSRSPVIIQTTPVARDYAGATMIIAMIDAAAEIFPDVIYALHLDHGVEAHIDSALSSGKYSSVMIDASHESFEDNVQRTSAIVKKAHAHGIPVEAELGVLSGVEDDIDVSDSQAKYTKPEEVLAFVSQSHCDSLAIAVGTSHGAYKFAGKQGIRFDILAMIQEMLPKFPLVLHGGSAVNPYHVTRINGFGGSMMTGSRGVKDEEIQKAIPLGICKVNIATDLRILWTAVHREHFYLNPCLFDPIVPGKQYRKELIEMLVSKFELLGSKGKSCNFFGQSNEHLKLRNQ
ncbi:class II fructose-bisphosphate aldolase [Belliella sp. DSM 111904]|uniref:Class II fructose-bisphosphate aldolase n=1 Tax=Belliella filtrata TaxID=2923435 RepID=A0ABS9UZ62_9BACT|nr:class II fructose-bisphosphate aldolase [Belliella filtrata]MCH7409447.1 class II fructose-bisphosphate aldolase [Belliella filtrata]